MFIVNTEIMVNWLISHTNTEVDRTEYDIGITKPSGEYEFNSSAIEEDGFIAPTDVSLGAASYKFTPDTEGVWIVTLLKGEPENYEVRSRYYLKVSTPDINVRQKLGVS